MSLRVLLVDDQPLIRVGFSAILTSQEDIEVVGQAGDGHEALDLAAALDPDVVCMDVQMPRLDGIEATRRLLAAGSRAAVLVLTTFDTDEALFAALSAGASGFLLKSAGPEEADPGRPGAGPRGRPAGPARHAQGAGPHHGDVRADRGHDAAFPRLPRGRRRGTSPRCARPGARRGVVGTRCPRRGGRDRDVA